MRVVVLGAGFGGLELTTILSEQFGPDLELVLVDRAESFVFGFSKLDVMFGRTTAEAVTHRYDDIVKPGVRFSRGTVRAIDPVDKVVVTDREILRSDVLVIALGADLDPAATPGLLDGGCEFYSVAGAFRAVDVLREFDGGRVIVGVTSTPFKCPPAPSETALLMHDLLRRRGLLDRSQVSLVMPLPTPIPPSPDASRMLLTTFEERGIGWHPNTVVRAIDPERKVAVLADGEMPFDLFLGVPKHRAPDVLVESGLAVDGWVPVDYTLETQFPGVFAIGDCTSVGTPKAGVFAEGQACVAGERITALLRGEEPTATYDGHGICYLEVGDDSVAKVDVTFGQGEAPTGALEGPSTDLVTDKAEFGSSRIQRWFGHDWN
ncbi:MAG: NAD(P)/FAD-dependent oxidoreductase [Frankiales bacterium]|nr:NAD(P)/FAD-dependent oxidoreductase [Frankiales bacterium]